MGDEKENELEKAIREAGDTPDGVELRKYADRLEAKNRSRAEEKRYKELLYGPNGRADETIGALLKANPKQPDYAKLYLDFPADDRPFIHRIVTAKSAKNARLLEYADFLGEKTTTHEFSHPAPKKGSPDKGTYSYALPTPDPKEAYIRVWLASERLKPRIIAHPDNERARQDYRRLMDEHASKLADLNETDARAIEFICPGAAILKSRGEFMHYRAEMSRHPYVKPEKPKKTFRQILKVGLFGEVTSTNPAKQPPAPRDEFSENRKKADEVFEQYAHAWLRADLGDAVPQKILDDMLGNPPTTTAQWSFKDGLLNELRLSEKDWNKYGAHILGKAPVTVALINNVTDLARVVATPGLEKVSRLSLSFGNKGRDAPTHADAATLTGAKQLARLEHLKFKQMDGAVSHKLQAAADKAESPLHGMQFTYETGREASGDFVESEGERTPELAKASAARYGFGPAARKARPRADAERPTPDGSNSRG